MTEDTKQPDTPETSAPAPTTPTTPTTPKRSDTSAALGKPAPRRAVLVLNFTLAVAALLLIVAILNTLGHLYFKRFDFTRTRQYSLAPQTRKILGQLESDVQVVTLIRARDPYIEQARDLISEYKRYSDKVAIQHIHPDRQVAQLDAFCSELIARYESELNKTRDAIRLGSTTMRDLAKQIAVQQAEMKEATDAATALVEQKRAEIEAMPGRSRERHPAFDLYTFVSSASRALQREASGIEESLEAIEGLEKDVLPAYQAIVSELRTRLSNLDEKLFRIAEAKAREEMNDPQNPKSVRDLLGVAADRFSTSRQTIQPALAQISDGDPPAEYDRVRRQIATGDCVVVMSPKQVRVLRIEGELIQRPDAEQVKAGQTAGVEFLVEEVLTGALISVTLDSKPKVVFVAPGSYHATGARGQMTLIAEQLRRLNYEVEQWTPGGQMGPMGQPMPPQPMPEIEEGQRAVWVLLPADQPSPMNPMAGEGYTKAIEPIKQRMVEGDGVLAILEAPWPKNMAPSLDPVTQMIETWGIRPNLSKVVYRSIKPPEGDAIALPQVEVSQWPAELPIGKALSGMTGAFLWASEIEYGGEQDKDKGIQYWPLVVVQGQDAFSTSDYNRQDYQSVKVPEDLDREAAFTVGVAAEGDVGRMVVVADPTWCIDMQRGGPVGYVRFNPNSPSPFTYAYPANAELFVNSVNWLAKLDQLIAASSRTQSVPRIGALSPAQQSLIGFGLPIGLPALVFAVGITVWILRRQG